MYLTGMGVEQNYIRAYTLYKVGIYYGEVYILVTDICHVYIVFYSNKQTLEVSFRIPDPMILYVLNGFYEILFPQILSILFKLFDF